MLSGEGKEKCEKTTRGLISKKTTLHVQHTFFVHLFAVVLHDYDYKVKRPETSWLHVLWRKCRTCSCSLFSPPLIFPWWPLEFLIFSPPLQIQVVLPTENGSLSLALALRRSFFRWASLACCLFSLILCLSLSLLTVSTSQDAGGYAISRKNIKLHLGNLPVDWVTLHWYTCGADGRRTSVLSRDYQILLGLGLRSLFYLYFSTIFSSSINKPLLVTLPAK